MKAGRFPCAVVKLSEPQRTTEAYFVAIVLHFDPAAGKPTEPVEASYITLEQGFETEGRPRTTLGEWTKTSHLNYGDGPPPDWEPFREAVTKLVEGRGRPPVARTGI